MIDAIASIMIRGFDPSFAGFLEHVNSGNRDSHSFTSPGIKVDTYYATLVQPTDKTKTPAVKTSWSGVVPMTLEN